jgi:hypothetical protein
MLLKFGQNLLLLSPPANVGPKQKIDKKQMLMTKNENDQ